VEGTDTVSINGIHHNASLNDSTELCILAALRFNCNRVLFETKGFTEAAQSLEDRGDIEMFYNEDESTYYTVTPQGRDRLVIRSE